MCSSDLGFLEKVYERALVRELALRELQVRAQVSMRVNYKGRSVGEYFADLLVEERLLVELKCVESFAPEHTAQCLNYLRASSLRLCLLLNFQHPKLHWKRLIL